MGTWGVTMEEEVGLECVNFINCTGTNFITNWTENNCVYKGVVTHNLRYLALSCTGIVAIVGVLANILILSSFLYVVTCKARIKKKFLRVEFSYMQEPIFPLVFNLSICDLIYCSFSFPMTWMVIFNGYFPFSMKFCVYAAAISHGIVMILVT